MIHKYQLTIDGAIDGVPFFLFDDTEHELNNRDLDSEATIIADLKKHVEGEATYHYRIILSEHVGGGEGSPEGSKLLETYAQLDSVEVDFNEHTENLLLNT